MIYLSNIAISGTDETQYVYLTCAGSIESLQSLSDVMNGRNFAITFDECTNIKNVDSLDVYDHDYSLTVNEITKCTIHLGVLTRSLFETMEDPGSSEVEPTDKIIYAAEIILQVKGGYSCVSFLDENIKYINIYEVEYQGLAQSVDYGEVDPLQIRTVHDILASGIFYDPKALYHAEIRALNKFCDTCMDDKQMQLIVLLTFKRQLLEQAIQCGHWKDALQLYMDLARILNIYIAKKDHGYSSTGCNSCLKYWDNSCMKYQDSECIHLQRPVCNGVTCNL